jgi:hypothetical protein
VDITLWNRLGKNLLGDLSGVAADEMGGTTTISSSETLSSSSANSKLFTLAELREDKARGGSGQW